MKKKQDRQAHYYNQGAKDMPSLEEEGLNGGIAFTANG